MDHTRRFMELLGNPDKKVKVIHVAGTNGKGSTCAYMNAILCEMGIATGLFTSPHLQCMTERIVINNKQITKDEFQKVFEETYAIVEQMAEAGQPHPSFFEFLFGMAMKYFSDSCVEYVILETGLGGRLDATNVVENPVVTILTNIGLDHTAYLGDTIEQIASEKAGILKKQVPVIYDGHLEGVTSVVESIALEKGCSCRKISEDAYEIMEIDEKSIAFSLKDAYDKHVTWKIRNRGIYQVTNACLAICAMQAVAESEGLEEDQGRWQEALLATYWPGRMEEVIPSVYIDGGHNVAAIEALTKEKRTYDVILYTAVCDKEYDEIIRILCREMKAKAYIVTSIEDQRGASVSELGQAFRDYTEKPVYVEHDLKNAWNLGLDLIGEDEKMLCLGSLYLVGMIKDMIQENENTGGIQDA